MRRHYCAALIALFAVPGRADTAVWLDCTPALPVYCANIHVGCAGRSALPAEPFTLAIDTDGALHRAGQAPVRLSVTSSDSGTVLRPSGSRDWIRVVRRADGDSFDFSRRIYRGGTALMAQGICRTAPTGRARPNDSP